MKSTKDFRPGSDDNIKKATKLEPIRKSGKERHALFKSLDQDDDEDADIKALHKRDSILDYMDDDDDQQGDEYDDDEFEDEFEDDPQQFDDDEDDDVDQQTR